MRSGVKKWALAIGVVLLVIWGRVWFSARADLVLGRAAESTGDLSAAITHHQHAMRWYSPFASAPVEAADALDRIAATAETKGERAVALPALRRLRGGILATRSIYSPFGARLDDVNQRLAVQTAEEQLALGDTQTIRGRDRDQLVADHLALLRLDPTPTPLWALLVVLSFLGWVGAVIYSIRFGFTSELKIRRKALVGGLLTTAVLFGLWVIGLMNA